ncbi:Ribosomal large subunit pseudouridine synthase C [Candidatus Profftia lariciata]|uniref:23S rRNA pseudouridine(955/2504/2580) synthase RluC n=1 Tax=Candidatus Profftia lariciata TaxID=1987921 RepID=UPI001D02D277|nr:23S rRNA pseudouridine(955/2504/2580) synthase RluC [Candidatus Profftia lariciata]UDG81515.1 Ribosomal large subunit pseudouridine synthase C [Candidatus Profftia lariciata]
MHKTQLQLVTITSDQARQRIDNFLRNQLKGVPKNMIYRIVTKGEVRVNKKRIKPQYKLQLGDKVRIPPVNIAQRNKIFISIKTNKIASLNYCIIFEDDYLLVLNKPSGTAVHGGSGIKFGIIEALRALRPESCFLELVHRLDRETSGVLLIAKKRSSLRILHEQLRIREMRKDYLALVHHQWPSYCKVVKVPLLKNILQSGQRVVQVNTLGKPAETYFTVEEYFDNATLIKARPVTGRTHQIRVHALYTGHPIAFDNRYGDRQFDLLLKDTGLNRLFLHATTLSFKHPNTGKFIVMKAPLDHTLNYCLNLLRKKTYTLKEF